MTRKKDQIRMAAALRMLRRFGSLPDETASDPLLLPGSTTTGQDLRAFLELAGRVDRDRPGENDLVALDMALATTPGLWRVLADLASRAVDTMIDQLNPSVSVRLSLRHGADELLASLAPRGSSPLESALVEQIAVCWIRLRIFEIRLAQATADPDAFTVRFWEERVAAAQRRYLAASESLARIRRLAARTPQLLQINVADQQVNFAGPAAGEE
jgi:hypothetical protein